MLASKNLLGLQQLALTNGNLLFSFSSLAILLSHYATVKVFWALIPMYEPLEVTKCEKCGKVMLGTVEDEILSLLCIVM